MHAIMLIYYTSITLFRSRTFDSSRKKKNYEILQLQSFNLQIVAAQNEL